ncbi:hypothetical protein NH340_JMT07446 [Sarcoptes scabiei]|nr:hypothetical protein NH340_JMT07446 [Sarcoptes scabiei]
MHSKIVSEFEDIVNDSFDRFHKLSTEIGGLVKEQVNLVRKALDAQVDFVRLASQQQKPSDNKLLELLKPTSDLIGQIISVRDQNRKDEHFNLLSSIAEGIGALGWVSISPTPAPYIKEMIDSAQFYTNKVLMTYKDKNSSITNWAKSWIEFLIDLQKYVHKNHTTGLLWNPKGNSLNGIGHTPLPPPPPPSANFFNETTTKTDGNNQKDSRAALFASINQGTDITKGLRKVTLDQQTPKNSLRQTESVPDRRTTKESELKKRTNAKLELEGKKWIVENQYQQNNLVISETDMSQSIIIYDCHESMLTVKGKVNLITVNQCKKFSIVFDSVVSVAEFINSHRLQVQVNGVVPTITVDKVDGIEIYLGEKTLDCEIVSSKSSEINVSVQNSVGDYVEHPLPEQFKSVWNGKSFKTIALEKN